MKNQNTLHSKISGYFLDIKNTLSNDQISSFVQSQICIYATGGTSTVAGFAYYIYNSYINRPRPPEESTVVRRVTDTLLNGQGLNSRAVDSARVFASSIAYELGRSINSMGTSFFQGMANRHEDAIRAAAEEADRRITSQRRS